MASSRTDYSRNIDYYGVKDARASMQRALVRFIGGIKGPRENPVTTKQVLAWFHGTPAEFVKEALFDATMAGEIESNVGMYSVAESEPDSH